MMIKSNSPVKLTRRQVWCDTKKLAQIEAIPNVIVQPSEKDSHIIVYAESPEIDRKIYMILEEVK